jgi:hypothetical protein
MGIKKKIPVGFIIVMIVFDCLYSIVLWLLLLSIS